MKVKESGVRVRHKTLGLEDFLLNVNTHQLTLYEDAFTADDVGVVGGLAVVLSSVLFGQYGDLVVYEVCVVDG